MNKGCIKVVLFLLSLFVYVTNKALASEQFPRKKPPSIFTSRKVTTRSVTTRYTHSSPGIPSNNRLNAAIQSNAHSNEVDRKSTRPIGAIQSNAHSNVATPNNAHSNVPNPRNAHSNVPNPRNAHSNVATPNNAHSNVPNPRNAHSNVAIPRNSSSNIATLSNDISNVVGSKITIQDTHGSDELYQEHKHLLCTDRGEIMRAEKVMKEAVPLLIQHATNTNNYDKPYQSKNNEKLNMAKHEGDTYIGKSNYKYPDPNMYTSLVNMLWDPMCSNKPDKTLKNGKVARVYTPNLILVQYRYRNDNESFQRYFYALAVKQQISENTTVIAMTSGNINDHNRADTKIYQNPIIASANLFKTEVNSEPDIRNGELKKMFVNLSGYLIKKESNYVDITYVRSIDGNVPNDSSLPTKTLRA
ncbi:fam-a protein [Plasmodium vinckei brucechwatti]|uniref:Fam-a protein n=1 Tax=Plasmodium vinckei brucechwatti TaxID=119398 RepID=A0A6V7SKF7_PLAVN|nr:fam-a protein [Plasmodium vinckei brucechwatti]